MLSKLFFVAINGKLNYCLLNVVKVCSLNFDDLFKSMPNRVIFKKALLYYNENLFQKYVINY